MPQHIVKIQRQYLHSIKDGTKTVEGRLDRGTFKTIKKDDTIIFRDNDNEKDTITKTVKYVKRYKTFKDMLIGEGLKQCLPNAINIDEGVKIYHSIADYKAEEHKTGVVAIKLNDPWDSNLF